MLGLSAVSVAVILDVVFIATVFLFACKDASKGFIRCLCGFMITAIAILISFLLAEEFTLYTGGLFGLEGVFSEKITELFSSIEGFDVAIDQNSLSTALDGVNLPQILKDVIISQGIKSDGNTPVTIASFLGDEAATCLTIALSSLLLFIVCKYVLRFVEYLLDKLVRSISMFGAFNGVLGAAVGATKGVLTLSFILAVLSWIPSLSFVDFIDSSYLVKYLYHDNPLNIIFANIFTK